MIPAEGDAFFTSAISPIPPCRGCRSAVSKSSAPPRAEPYKTHLAYVKERRSDTDGAAILEEALNRIRR